MAEGGKLVLSNVLCFVANKIGKTPVKSLKSILSDFYDAEVLCEAKVRLLDDTKSLETSVKLPHIPRRREGDNRVVREIDDIITIFTRLDELKLLDQLPKYCASGPDEMPSSRMCEGDLNVFMTMLRKLHGKIDEFGSAMAAISRDVEVLQTRLPPEPFPPLPRADFAQPPRQPATGISTYRKSESSTSATEGHSADRQLNKSTGSVQRAKRSEIPSREARESTDVNSANSRSRTSGQAPGGYSWSAAMSTPNRYAVLAGDDDEHDDVTDGDGDGDGERRFTTVGSRRIKRNRQPSSPQATQAQFQQGEQPRRQRAPVLAGRSSVAGNKIAAAKILRKKAVFCLDNLSNSCTPSDIKSFVSGLSVEVFSVFGVKPRRRRGEDADGAVDRKAFRLCINADDRERLLDPSVWPDSVLISQWYFKQQDSKRTRLSTSSSSNPTTETGDRSSVDELHVDNDNDDTIVENMDSDNGGQLTNDDE